MAGVSSLSASPTTAVAQSSEFHGISTTYRGYRHGTHVFVNWLKLDPLFMMFGHFCNNKEEIKNMGDSTSLR